MIELKPLLSAPATTASSNTNHDFKLPSVIYSKKNHNNTKRISLESESRSSSEDLYNHSKTVQQGINNFESTYSAKTAKINHLAHILRPQSKSNSNNNHQVRYSNFTCYISNLNSNLEELKDHQAKRININPQANTSNTTSRQTFYCERDTHDQINDKNSPALQKISKCKNNRQGEPVSNNNNYLPVHVLNEDIRPENKQQSTSFRFLPTFKTVKQQQKQQHHSEATFLNNRFMNISSRLNSKLSGSSSNLSSCENKPSRRYQFKQQYRAPKMDVSFENDELELSKDTVDNFSDKAKSFERTVFYSKSNNKDVVKVSPKMRTNQFVKEQSQVEPCIRKILNDL